MISRICRKISASSPTADDRPNTRAPVRRSYCSRRVSMTQALCWAALTPGKPPVARWRRRLRRLTPRRKNDLAHLDRVCAVKKKNCIGHMPYLWTLRNKGAHHVVTTKIVTTWPGSWLYLILKDHLYGIWPMQHGHLHSRRSTPVRYNPK